MVAIDDGGWRERLKPFAPRITFGCHVSPWLVGEPCTSTRAITVSTREALAYE
jgi:hypothetical protein